MPKKKKLTSKVTKKVSAKSKKAPTKALAKKRVLNVNKKVITKVAPKKTPRASIVKKQRIDRLEISPQEQIVHAAETYAVSIDEIIRSGNQEYKLMQMNGRGQEITAPKIEVKKQVEAVHAPEKIVEEVVEIQEMKTEEVVNESVDPESLLTEEDKKALAMVRAKLEASTVMIRSVSPLQTPFAHSSRNFVREKTETKSKASLVFLSSAAIVFAAFVVAVVVTKAGNISSLPLPVTFAPAAAPSNQKVLGAEVWPQQYAKSGEYTFSYPGNWYLSESAGKITLTDNQTNPKNTVKVVTASLGGKSFQDWLGSSSYKELKVTQSKTEKNVYTAQEGNTAFIVGTSEVAVLQAMGGNTATTTLMNVLSSFTFVK